jgi:hypothetical protein
MGKKSSNSLVSMSDDESWKAERDLETLMEAERISADPKRLAKARALAKQKMLAVAKVASDTDD